MKEKPKKAARRPRRMRTTQIALPWAKLFWRDWLSDPNIRRLTNDQRSRFMDVWASTHGTPTPGLMTEEDVRGWASLSASEWKQQRDRFVPLFKIDRRGRWHLVDVEREFKASLEAAKTRARVAMAGVEKRKQLKEMATDGCTDGQPPVQPTVEHRCSDPRSSEPQISAVPEPQTSAGSVQTRTPTAGGTSGTEGHVSAGDMLARGIGDAGLRPARTNTGSGRKPA